jgi:tRNA threonylcarbamoyladenosine biosynthesis protein TsaE
MDSLFTLDQLPKIAAAFWDHYGDHHVFAFKGGMGAGKTTFIHAIADYLKIRDAVSSPTFSIINHYITGEGRDCYHLDLYRLSNQQEALDLDVEELLSDSAICFIEWPEIIAGILPSSTVWLEIIPVDHLQRRLKVTQAR